MRTHDDIKFARKSKSAATKQGSHLYAVDGCKPGQWDKNDMMDSVRVGQGDDCSVGICGLKSAEAKYQGHSCGASIIRTKQLVEVFNAEFRSLANLQITKIDGQAMVHSMALLKTLPKVAA